MKKRVPRTVQRVRKLLKGMTVGMLTTQTAAGDTQSRPMLVQDVDEQGWLWFLTDRTSRKACELSQNPHAAVLFLAIGRHCHQANAEESRPADPAATQNEIQAVVNGFTILNDDWLALARSNIAQLVNLDAGQIEQPLHCEGSQGRPVCMGDSGR
jgi:hypothetical protein